MSTLINTLIEKIKCCFVILFADNYIVMTTPKELKESKYYKFPKKNYCYINIPYNTEFIINAAVKFLKKVKPDKCRFKC